MYVQPTLNIYCLCSLCSTDIFFDGGCSGGTCLFVVTCLSDCIGLGIDIDDNRIALANLHSKSVMESNSIDKDIKIAFAERDISLFQSFNGVTVLYLYDCAFDKRQNGLLVAAINATDSLRCFISSQSIDIYRSLGLIDVWKQTDDIHVTQIGGKTARKLCIYIKCVATTGSVKVDEFIEDMSVRASDATLRKAYLDSAHNTWLKSKDFIRSSKIPADTKYCIDQSYKLFDLLTSKTYFLNPNIARFYVEGTLKQDLNNWRSKYR